MLITEQLRSRPPVLIPKLQDYNSETAQKINVIFHNFFCFLIGLVEILLKKSSSMGGSIDRALKGDENQVQLRSNG